MPLILLYHDVVDMQDDASGFPGGGAARYKLRRDEFQGHLDAIEVAIRQPATTMSSLASGTDAPLLTFDDGGVSAATIIADLLEKRNWRGHFLITTDYIGRPGFVDKRQIRDLAARGHGIGSHSCSHPTRMAACSRQQLLDEWRRSREVLSDILGESVESASVPGGYYSRPVAEAAAESGLRVLFNSEPTRKSHDVAGCKVYGRYSIYRGMKASAAAALARGASLALLRQSAAWKMKKAAKAVGGRFYLGIREFVLNRKFQKEKTK